MAVVYPDILLTLWDNWHAARTSDGCMDGRYHSFSETYLNYFLLHFRSFNEKLKREEQKNVAVLIKRMNAEQQEQMKNLREFCLGIRKSGRSDFVSPDDICDWLTNIFLNMSRETIEQSFRKKSSVVGEIRKYYARTRNRAGYELSEKLHRALHALDSEGRIEVGKLVNGKIVVWNRDLDGRFRDETCFRLKTASGSVAQFDDYEENRDSVPFYHTRPRRDNRSSRGESEDDGDPSAAEFQAKTKTFEHSSIITPKDAKDLVEKLLGAFNGWTSFSDIQSAAWNHVPRTLKLVSDDSMMMPDEEDRGESRVSSKAHAKDDLIKDVSDYVDSIIMNIAADKSKTIWDKICEKTSKEFFCLYILPEKAKKAGLDVKSGKSAKLEDFGSPATMAGKMTKVGEIFREELLKITIIHGKEVELESEAELKKAGTAEDAEKVSRPVEDARLIVQIVFRLLNRRCNDSNLPTGVEMGTAEQPENNGESR